MPCTARRWRSTTSCGSRCPTTSCARVLRRGIGRAAVHPHRHPVAARGRRDAGGERGRRRPPGQRRPARDTGTRCSTSTAGDARRRAGAGRLRLARAGGSRCARRACPSRSWRRSRPAGGRPAWRSCRRAERVARALPRVPRGDAGRLRRRTASGWADAPEQADDGLPVVSMFGTAAVPAAAVGVLELPLQPGLRLLRGGVLARRRAGARSRRDRFRALRRRGGGGGLPRAVRDRRRAVRAPRHGRDGRVRVASGWRRWC